MNRKSAPDILSSQRSPGSACPGADSAGPLAVLVSITGAGRRVPWQSFACAATALALAWMAVSPLLAKLMGILLFPLLTAWLIACLAYRMAHHWRPGWWGPWSWAICSLSLGNFGVMILHRLLLAPEESIAFPKLATMALAALVWAGAVALPLAILQRQVYRAELAELRLSAVSAELKALQAQIEPHFLYNTLANTRYLARHQPERAVEMLDHLIAYLHQALPDMRAQTSSVARECGLAQHYLALMAIRFGERLRYTVEVDEAVADAAMPPLLLISLVENAVRHGVEPMPGTVTVSLRAWRDGGQLRLAVCDDGPGPGLQGPTGSGVGLRNVRERLRALFGDRAGMTLTRGADQLTRAELSLPLHAPAA